MKLEPSIHSIDPLNGFSRTATEQALENLTQALRALELAPRDNSDLCPHPLTIVRAEIENARRYLSDTAHTQPSTRAAKTRNRSDISANTHAAA